MLEQALARFDGKTTAVLSEIRAAHRDRPAFLTALIRLAAHEDSPISDGATWLIKDLLDDGVRLTQAQTEDLVGQLPAVTSWSAQLHLCQCVRHLDPPAAQESVWADWLSGLLISERPFLRAWSMDGLQHLAARDSRLEARAAAALEAAENDPAASVRARARQWR